MVRSPRGGPPAARLALAVGLVATVVISGSHGVSATAPAQPVDGGATVALIGHQDHGQVEVGTLLTASGLDVEVVEFPRDEVDPTVIAAADLVLLAVSAVDGPMPGTLQLLQDLDGFTIDRLAVLLTKTDLNEDAELIDLVRFETLELLQRYGVPASVPVLDADAPSFVDDVTELLSGLAEGVAVVAPTTTAPTTSFIPGVDGLGLERATALLEGEGLIVTVIADPALPVEVDCAPPVRRQVPEPGLVVPRGTTVGVIGGLRASSLACDLPVLSADELEAALDALSQQPGLPPRFVTMPVVTNNIPLSLAVADLEALGLVVEAVPTPGNFGLSCDPAVEIQVPEFGVELERGTRVLVAVNLDLDYSTTPGAPECQAWDAVSLDQFDELVASVLAQ